MDTLGLAVAEGTKELIELGAKRFLEEVPALKQLKLVLRLDLRARRDSQTGWPPFGARWRSRPR